METITPPAYVLVTGAAGGIGSAVCKLLPTVGLTPIVGFNRQAEAAESLAESLGGFALKLDLSQEASITQALDRLKLKLADSGVVRGAVLAASPPPDLSAFFSLTPAQMQHQLQMSVVGTHQLLAGLIKTFWRKTKVGSVVGVLSQAVGDSTRAPATGMASYVVAKAALQSLLAVCAAEYPWLQVRTVSPGFTKTGMLDVFDARYLEMMNAQQAFASPEEVAQLIIREMMQ